MRKWYFILLFLCLLLPVYPASASALYQDDETGYVVIIEDDAELLTPAEEAELALVMLRITPYGNVALKTIQSNSYSTYSYAYDYYEYTFGSASGTLFLIDMDNRELCIHSSGYNYRVITNAYGDTITDNVYRYASSGDYYTCCCKAFEQVFSLLEGQRIAQPMKYICNALLAVILALLFTYFLVRQSAASNRVSKQARFSNVKTSFSIANQSAIKVKTSKVYSAPKSHGGGGHSGGSHSHGGHSGGGHSHGGHSHGGHSGGGGSHRF